MPEFEKTNPTSLPDSSENDTRNTLHAAFVILLTDDFLQKTVHKAVHDALAHLREDINRLDRSICSLEMNMETIEQRRRLDSQDALERIKALSRGICLIGGGVKTLEQRSRFAFKPHTYCGHPTRPVFIAPYYDDRILVNGRLRSVSPYAQ